MPMTYMLPYEEKREVTRTRRPHPPVTEDEKYVDAALRVAWEQMQRGQTIPAEEVNRYFEEKFAALRIA